MAVPEKPPGLLKRALDLIPILPRAAKHASSAEMARIHRLASRLALQGATPWQAAVVRNVDWFYWPIAVFLKLRALPAPMFDSAAAQAGRTRFAHFLAVWRACVTLGLSPGEYHQNAFHWPDRAGLAGDHLTKYESLRIYRGLYEMLDKSDLVSVDDKTNVDRFCRENGLRTTCLLAVAQDGRIDLKVPETDSAWKTDLITKPALGSNGSGFYRWLYQEDGTYVGALGESLSREGVLDQVVKLARSKPMLVQQRMVNDAKTAKLSSGALATARIVTGRGKSGEVKLIAAAIKLPVGYALVDNYMRGNVLVQIDVESGKMLPGLFWYNQLKLIDSHPETGERFAGETLPQWDQIAALAQSAHANWPKFVLLAFDIAPTPDGPAIVEINGRGDLTMIQYPPARPLGRSDYPSIVLSHFGDETL